MFLILIYTALLLLVLGVSVLFKFKATEEEISDIVRNARMKPVKYYGRNISWSSVRIFPYWFRPKYKPEGQSFHAFSKYLYYDPETQWAYFLYIES